MKLGEKIYTPAEAAEVLGGLYTESTLKRRASEGKFPHLGGKGKGNLRFSESHLLWILKDAEVTPQPEPVVAQDASEQVVELPDFFRQTSRSRARHRKKVA